MAGKTLGWPTPELRHLHFSARKYWIARCFSVWFQPAIVKAFSELVRFIVLNESAALERLKSNK
jgi:hypothetical protein